MVDAYGGVVGHWRVHTTCDVTDQNNGAAKIRAITYFQAVDSWDYYGLNADYGASVNGQVASTSTSGGINVGANGQQNIATCEIWVNKGHGNTNIGFGGYINVHGYAGGSSSANGSITIGGKPSYTVSYNANGGSGAPGSQTRWWGEVINLSNTKPTRTNYEFLGWSTSAGGGVNYPSGARYGEDTSRTLYAVWKLSLVPPSLTDVTSWRSDASGATQNDGTYVTVKAAWSVDTKVDSNNSGMKMVVNDGAGDDTTTLSGTSGTYQKTFANKNVANSYTFTLTLVDKHMSVAATTMIGPAFFLLDINPTGTAIGIGQAAPDKGLLVGGVYFAPAVSDLPTTGVSNLTKAFVNGQQYAFINGAWLVTSAQLYQVGLTRITTASDGIGMITFQDFGRKPSAAFALLAPIDGETDLSQRTYDIRIWTIDNGNIRVRLLNKSTAAWVGAGQGANVSWAVFYN